MKKISAILLSLILCFSFALPVFAADGEATVTISVNGALMVTNETVELSDKDGDGNVTLNDVMILVHDSAFEGGAEAGFASAESEYGLGMTKLWGVENGGGYGYYVNNAPAMNLSDPVKDQDTVYAFTYSDLVTWSDTYSFFDKNTVSGNAGDEVTLKLSVAAFDAEYNYTPNPLEGAVITFDGRETEFVTDSNGEVTFTLPDDAFYLTISAKKDGVTLVPPVCVAEVEEAEEPVEPSENPAVDSPSADEETKTDSEKTAEPEKNSATVWIVVGIVCGAAVIACAVYFIVRKKKQ